MSSQTHTVIPSPSALSDLSASLAVQAGVSIYKVSRWMGHGDCATTQIYAHLAPGYDEDIDKLAESAK